MLSQTSQSISFHAFFTRSGAKVAPSPAPTVSIERKGSGSLLVSGGATTAGLITGHYYYTLSSGGTASADDYLAVFSTTDATVDQQDVPALWVAGNSFAESTPHAAPTTAGGLPTIGTGAGQLQPDGAGNVPAGLTVASLQKAAREAQGVAGTLWHVSTGGSDADGLTWATAKTSPSGLYTTAGDALFLAAGQTFSVGSSGVALADGVCVLGNGASVVGTALGPDALVTWGGANACLRDVTIDASAVYGLNPLSGGETNTALTNARLDRARLRGVIDCLVYGGNDLTLTDCDLRTDYTVDAAGHTVGHAGYAGDGGFADATNLSGGTVRFVGGLVRADGRGVESTRALNVTGGATVWAEETILEALNPPGGGHAYAVFAAGAGTTVHVTGKRIAGSPYDVSCNTGATVILTDVAGSGTDGAITVDPAGTGTVITRGKSRTAAAAVASAVWGAASRTVTGATSPLPTTTAGTGPYALTHDGGTGAAGAPITVAGSPAGTDRLRVVDPLGNGIAGAVLRLYLASDTTFSNPLAATTTGPDGRWVGPMYCGSGSYKLVISYPGSQSDSETVGVP